MVSLVQIMLKTSAMWIKEYTHPLKAIGGLFFVLAFLTGIIWAFGKDVEAIGFVFALLSSMFFSSPSVAEYIVPSRKPIRHMNLDEILQFIIETHPKNDWKLVHSKYTEEAFLKEDMRLRIRVRWDEEDRASRSFHEVWATNFPDSNATRDWYDLLYDGNLIERYMLISVDGGRAELPLPDLGTKEVGPCIFKIAQIFDASSTLNEYMRRAGLTLKNI